MKTHLRTKQHANRISRITHRVSRFTFHVSRFALWLLALAGILVACQLQTALADDQAPQTGSAAVTVQSGPGDATIAVNGAGPNHGAVVVRTIEPLAEGGQPPRHNPPWLGVGVEEASEALTSQLNLALGVGLVVIYVAPDSPAAKAGLEQNDVLVEFDKMPLVHPAQLRKLVRVRKESDKVELGFYRAGKKQTVSATLVKAPPGYGLLEDGEALGGDLYALMHPFRNPSAPQAYHDMMKAYRDQLGHLKIDQGKVQEEVSRSLAQARRAMEEALRMRYPTNAASSATAMALRELQRYGFMADTGSSVTVRSSGDKVRSIVKADESGTYVIVSNPKPYLTAHDKDGKLLFDGEIATPEQRAKVPPEVWEKVEPMLDKLTQKAEDEPAPGPRPPRPLPPRPLFPPAPPPPGNTPNTL